MNNEMNMVPPVEPVKTKKKVLPLILIIIVVLACAGGLTWFLLKGKDTKNTENKTKTEEKEKQEQKKSEEASIWNGIYKLNDWEIKIYKHANIVYYQAQDTKKGTDISAYAPDMKDDKREFSSFDTSMKVVEDGVEVVASDDIPSGVYKKEKDYTKEDFFTDNYGDLKYFDSKYNGEWGEPNYKMYTYQKSANEVRVSMTVEGNGLDMDFEILPDGNLEGRSFDDVYSITFDGDVAKFTTTQSPNGNITMDGTYKKVGTITIDDALDYTN